MGASLLDSLVVRAMGFLCTCYGVQILMLQKEVWMLNPLLNSTFGRLCPGCDVYFPLMGVLQIPLVLNDCFHTGHKRLLFFLCLGFCLKRGVALDCI